MAYYRAATTVSSTSSPTIPPPPPPPPHGFLSSPDSVGPVPDLGGSSSHTKRSPPREKVWEGRDRGGGVERVEDEGRGGDPKPPPSQTRSHDDPTPTPIPLTPSRAILGAKVEDLLASRASVGENGEKKKSGLKGKRKRKKREEVSRATTPPLPKAFEVASAAREALSAAAEAKGVLDSLKLSWNAGDLSHGWTAEGDKARARAGRLHRQAAQLRRDDGRGEEGAGERRKEKKEEKRKKKRRKSGEKRGGGRSGVEKEKGRKKRGESVGSEGGGRDGEFFAVDGGMLERVLLDDERKRGAMRGGCLALGAKGIRRWLEAEHLHVACLRADDREVWTAVSESAGESQISARAAETALPAAALDRAREAAIGAAARAAARRAALLDAPPLLPSTIPLASIVGPSKTVGVAATKLARKGKKREGGEVEGEEEEEEEEEEVEWEEVEDWPRPLPPGIPEGLVMAWATAGHEVVAAAERQRREMRKKFGSNGKLVGGMEEKVKAAQQVLESIESRNKVLEEKLATLAAAVDSRLGQEETEFDGEDGGRIGSGERGDGDGEGGEGEVRSASSSPSLPSPPSPTDSIPSSTISFPELTPESERILRQELASATERVAHLAVERAARTVLRRTKDEGRALQYTARAKFDAAISNFARKSRAAMEQRLGEARDRVMAARERKRVLLEKLERVEADGPKLHALKVAMRERWAAMGVKVYSDGPLLPSERHAGPSFLRSMVRDSLVAVVQHAPYSPYLHRLLKSLVSTARRSSPSPPSQSHTPSSTPSIPFSTPPAPGRETQRAVRHVLFSDAPLPWRTSAQQRLPTPPPLPPLLLPPAEDSPWLLDAAVSSPVPVVSTIARRAHLLNSPTSSLSSPSSTSSPPPKHTTTTTTSTQKEEERDKVEVEERGEVGVRVDEDLREKDVVEEGKKDGSVVVVRRKLGEGVMLQGEVEDGGDDEEERKAGSLLGLPPGVLHSGDEDEDDDDFAVKTKSALDRSTSALLRARLLEAHQKHNDARAKILESAGNGLLSPELAKRLSTFASSKPSTPPTSLSSPPTSRRLPPSLSQHTEDHHSKPPSTLFSPDSGTATPESRIHAPAPTPTPHPPAKTPRSRLGVGLWDRDGERDESVERSPRRVRKAVHFESPTLASSPSGDSSLQDTLARALAAASSSPHA